jgi:hypothetical protein
MRDFRRHRVGHLSVFVIDHAQHLDRGEFVDMR